MEVAHPCVGVTAFPRNSRATLTGSQKPTRRCTGLVGAHPQAGGSNASLSRVQSAECRVRRKRRTCCGGSWQSELLRAQTVGRGGDAADRLGTSDIWPLDRHEEVNGVNSGGFPAVVTHSDANTCRRRGAVRQRQCAQCCGPRAYRRCRRRPRRPMQAAGAGLGRWCPRHRMSASAREAQRARRATARGAARPRP